MKASTASRDFCETCGARVTLLGKYIAQCTSCAREAAVRPQDSRGSANGVPCVSASGEVSRACRNAWVKRGCPLPPPRPQFCANCIRVTPALLVCLTITGRPVWLCASCRELRKGREA